MRQTEVAPVRRLLKLLQDGYVLSQERKGWCVSLPGGRIVYRPARSTVRAATEAGFLGEDRNPTSAGSEWLLA